MTQEHPITPPPELVKQWEGTAYNAAPIPYTHHIARCAARWGADQELDACCEWLVVDDWKNVSENLRAFRRPKPPNLKEQALAVLDDASDRLDAVHENIIRRALEMLPNE